MATAAGPRGRARAGAGEGEGAGVGEGVAPVVRVREREERQERGPIFGGPGSLVGVTRANPAVRSRVIEG
jgi:hypothetical protein